MMRTQLLTPLSATFLNRAGSRHGSPRPGTRAFRAVHDHEYWNNLGLDEVYHTYAALLEVNGISQHQVLLERTIDAFPHKDAGDAITAVSARFPHSDAKCNVTGVLIGVVTLRFPVRY